MRACVCVRVCVCARACMFMFVRECVCVYLCVRVLQRGIRGMSSMCT